MTKTSDVAKPRFSLAGLLLTVAAVATVLGLMIQAPPRIAAVTLFAMVVVLLAFLTVAIIYATDNWRPLCIGAIFPLAIPFLFAAMNCGYLILCFETEDPQLEVIGVPNAGGLRFLLGGSLLASIALGHLCVAFRWIIDRPKPDK